MLNLSEVSVVVKSAIDKLFISGCSVEQFLNLMDLAVRFYTASVGSALSQLYEQNRLKLPSFMSPACARQVTST
jgi:hypothetical protein